MRPVSNEFKTSQGFGSYATGGVVGNARGTTVQQLVAAYGNYQPHGHAGEDIATPVGTPVRAISDGTVLYAGWAEDLPGDESWGWAGYFRRWALYKGFPGICSVVQHWWGVGVYAHLSNNDMAPAITKVKEGQIIALSGDTKTRNSKVGPHLHVEALVDLSYRTGGGKIYGRVDPTQFYGSVAPASAAVTPPPEEEDEDDMPLIIATAPDSPGKIWVGNGVERSHIPNPKILEGKQWLAKNGIGPKYFEDGKVAFIPAGIDTIGRAVKGEVTESELVIGKVAGDGQLWIGDGIERRLIPDVAALEELRKLGREGAMPLFKDGETQTVSSLDGVLGKEVK